ncbi:MAG: hypothetical protein OEY67_03305 [Gammaproteobacteria bacterium]|nr:hypothetical protein [Gammaproteobacteria bacterium]
MSIFTTKSCPLCQSVLSGSIDRCYCGYSFAPSAEEETAQNALLRAQEEKLYEQYLKARVDQAKEMLIIAESVYAQKPDNNDHRQHLQDARAGLDKAIEELAVQSALVNETQRLAVAAKDIVSRYAQPNRASQERQTEKKIDSVSLGKNQPQKTIKQAVKKSPRNFSVPAKLLTAVKTGMQKSWGSTEKIKSVAKNVARKTEREPAITTVNMKAAVTSAPKSIAIQHKPDAKPAGNPVQPIALAKTSATASKPMPIRHEKQKQPVITSSPGKKFKSDQSEKAAAIMALAMKVIAAGEQRQHTLQSVAQEKTDIVMHPRPVPKKIIKQKTMNCPHCTATIRVDEERCGCGYQLSRPSAEIPGIVLNDNDLALLEEPKSVQITKFG